MQFGCCYFRQEIIVKKKKPSALLKTCASVLSVSTICALTLAACGGGGGGDSDNNVGTSNSGGTVTAKDAFAYITQRGTAADTGSVLRCDLDAASGNLSNCADSGAGTTLSGPISLALTDKYAYILNFPVGGDPLTNPNVETITQCSLDSATGALSNCVNSGANETAFIFDFAINGNFGYTLKRFGNQIMQCGLDATTGALSNCGEIAGITGLHEPLNMAFKDSRVYIANADLSASSVSVCSVASDTGVISDCKDANASPYNFNPTTTDDNGNTVPKGVGPTGIAIKGSTAYIVSSDNKNVIRCEIGTDGTFTSCADNALTGVTALSPYRIGIYGNNAYITNASSTAADNNVYKCSISSDNTLGACAAAGVTNITSELDDIKFLAKP